MSISWIGFSTSTKRAIEIVRCKTSVNRF